jgi:hypothetical protein
VSCCLHDAYITLTSCLHISSCVVIVVEAAGAAPSIGIGLFFLYTQNLMMVRHGCLCNIDSLGSDLDSQLISQFALPDTSSDGARVYFSVYFSALRTTKADIPVCL